MMENENKCIVVTGGCGFIGSNVVKSLCKQGYKVIVVEKFENGRMFKNIQTETLADFYLHDAFFDLLAGGHDKHLNISAIIHLGATSSTTSWDGPEVIKNNFEYSKMLSAYCNWKGVPFIYASSAAVYGKNGVIPNEDDKSKQAPLNLYGYSKFLFDNWIAKQNYKNKSIGLRFFNVYGPGEEFKVETKQCSPVYKYITSYFKDEPLVVFEGDDGHGSDAIHHQRDFVYVEDVVHVIEWFLNHKDTLQGVYNVGSGISTSFYDVAKSVKKAIEKEFGSNSECEILLQKMPDILLGKTQASTRASLTKLREAGYAGTFCTIEEGTEKTLKKLIELNLV